MEIKEILRRLCTASGAQTEETAVSEQAVEMLKKLCDSAETDAFGNVTALLGRDDSKQTLMLNAHIDRVGLIVKYIDDDGFLRVAPYGGVDRRTLLAQSVTVWSDPPVKGIIPTLPPHVASDSTKSVKVEDIAIDIGMTAERARECVSLGDRVTIDGDFSELSNNMLCGGAVDDRAGAAAILYALTLLQGKDLAFNIAVQFATQEEIGSRGTTISTFNIKPDYAIAVDVSFGTSPGVSASDSAKLGSGTMIGLSPVLSKEVSDTLKSLAKSHDIPFTPEVMSGRTGTDADAISLTRGGVKTGLLSIPERYMHMPCEVVKIDDIKATAELIAAFAQGN